MAIIVINSPKYGRKEVLVDDEDFEYLNQFKWSIHKTKKNMYASRTIYLGGGRKNQKNKKFSMHREIMQTPVGMDCDHTFHNTLDNRKSQLRNCTRTQNLQNKTSAVNSTSKYLGVTIHTNKYFKKKTNVFMTKIYWVAQIVVNRKLNRIRYFPYTPCGELLAALTYDEAAIKYHGEFANLNFKTKPLQNHG
jgi:hypothetical protein